MSIIVDTVGERLDEFVRVYHGTMTRRQAGQGYFFDRAFFPKIAREMPGSVVFFHAIHDGRVVSTELVLVSVVTCIPTLVARWKMLSTFVQTTCSSTRLCAGRDR